MLSIPWIRNKFSEKLKCFLKKTRVPFFSSANESATFPYKPTLSKANVKTNWMGGTNEPFTKNEFLPLTVPVFLENLI